MIEESYKAILIRGEFNDIQHLIEVAGHEAKQIFRTSEKVMVKDCIRWDPYGWVVLVARPRGVVQMRPTVGVGGVKA
jgi:hypothetical protein